MQLKLRRAVRTIMTIEKVVHERSISEYSLTNHTVPLIHQISIMRRLFVYIQENRQNESWSNQGLRQYLLVPATIPDDQFRAVPLKNKLASRKNEVIINKLEKDDYWRTIGLLFRSFTSRLSPSQLLLTPLPASAARASSKRGNPLQGPGRPTARI